MEGGKVLEAGGGDGYTAENVHGLTEAGTEELRGKRYIICSLPNTNLLIEVLGLKPGPRSCSWASTLLPNYTPGLGLPIQKQRNKTPSFKS